MFYVLSTTYAWFQPKHQEKTSGLQDYPQEKKGGRRRGETQEKNEWKQNKYTASTT
jgi:hypothetical protein